MTREAELAIGEAFDAQAGPATFNPLIDRLSTEALNHGMDRPTLIRLLLNEVAAVSGEGRREARQLRGGTGQEAMIYQAINSQAQAAKTMSQAADRRR